MTKAFAETQASLETQALPSQFSNVIEDAGRQCAAMCIECACRQVQASHLRLATSDLFDAPSGPASGTALTILTSGSNFCPVYT